MLKRMRSVRVLFYADMDSIIPHCVAAADMLRSQLGAHIIMTVLDRRTNIDRAFKDYELYDHKSLFQLSSRFVPIKWIHSRSIGDPIDAASAGPMIDGDVSPNNGTEAPGRIELFGLRKILSRSDVLKVIYARMLLGMRQLIRGFCIRRFLRVIHPDIIILAEDNVERLS